MPSAYSITTFHDLLERSRFYLGANVSGQAVRDIKIAIANAVREFGNARKWVYYKTLGRIATVAPYRTGTIAYTQATRQVTLTGGTWPTWAAAGVINIDTVPYTVAARVSDMVLTLTATENPGADVAAGKLYELYQEAYDLPSDLVSAADFIEISGTLALLYVDPNEWLTRQIRYTGPSTPGVYTITGSTEQRGVLAIRLHPPPSRIYPLAFMYHRRPRQLVIDEYTTGTASCTSGGTTVTGVGTTFTAAMVGSDIRLGDDAVNLPTGNDGPERFAQERIIAAFTSATSVTVDEAFGQTLTGVRFRISDPVDVEDGAMQAALEACVYKHLAMNKRMENRRQAELDYRAALLTALEADSRSFAPQVAGPRWRGDWRTQADMSQQV